MKTILVMILAVAPFYSFSQVKIYNIFLKDFTRKILYLGLDNVLKVEGKNSKFNECSMTIDKGKIVAIGNNQYQIKPEISGIAIVSYYEKGTLVLSEKWNIQRIPADLNSAGIKQKFPNFDIIETPQKQSF
jgi:hypothetical protein